MKRIRSYEHKVQYYETDQMRIVHHSNYIKWFEEARTDFLERVGMGYDVMEKKGIYCPVLEINANYLRMVEFGDTVQIKLTIKTYNGIKLIVGYQVKSEETGLIHCIGESKHCFLNEKMQPVFLKKDFKEFHELFMEYSEPAKQNRKKPTEQTKIKKRRIKNEN